MIRDWALIIGVMACVLAVYWMVGNVIDACLDLWRNREAKD